MDKKESRARILTLWLIIVSVLVSIFTNLATNVLPTSVQLYSWIAWPLLGLLVIVYLILTWLQISPNPDNKTRIISSEAKLLAENAIKKSKKDIDSYDLGHGLKIEITNLPHLSRLSAILFSLKYFLRRLIPTSLLLFILWIFSSTSSRKIRDLVTLPSLLILEERKIELVVKKAGKQTRDLINVAKKYDQAIEYVEYQRKIGKLSQKEAESTLEALKQDFEIALDQVIGKHIDS